MKSKKIISIALTAILALGLLGIRQIRTGNFIPALILAPLTQYLYSLLPL